MTHDDDDDDDDDDDVLPARQGAAAAATGDDGIEVEVAAAAAERATDGNAARREERRCSAEQQEAAVIVVSVVSICELVNFEPLSHRIASGQGRRRTDRPMTDRGKTVVLLYVRACVQYVPRLLRCFAAFDFTASK